MHIRHAVLVIFLLSLCAPLTTAEAAEKFDPSPWLEDFSALKTGMEDRYANLAWFGSPAGGVDLPKLEQHTLSALGNAENPAEARQLIKDFVGALGDGHFSVLSDDPPTGDAHAEPAPFVINPADSTTGCAALGFASRGRIGFSLPFEALPGFRLESDGVARGFRAGILPIRPGLTLGIVRIGEFRQTGTIWACLDAWAARIQAGKTIDADAIETAAEDQWFRAMSDALHRFAAEHVAAVVVDIGNNNGGNDLGDWMPRLFTSRPVHSARMLVARSPLASGYQNEEIEDLKKPLPGGTSLVAKAAIDRAIAEFEAQKTALSAHECNMSWVWREQRPWQPGSPCSRLVDAGSAAGSLDYLAPHTFDTDIAKRIYWAAVADDYLGAWTGAVYVVTDDHSYSAAELFASSMQINRIAKTVGQRTGGDGCGFVTDIPPLVLPHSHMALRVPNCVRLRADGADEVAGVPPDLPVLPLKGESARARAARMAEVIAGDLAGKP